VIELHWLLRFLQELRLQSKSSHYSPIINRLNFHGYHFKYFQIFHSICLDCTNLSSLARIHQVECSRELTSLFLICTSNGIVTLSGSASLFLVEAFGLHLWKARLRLSHLLAPPLCVFQYRRVDSPRHILSSTKRDSSSSYCIHLSHSNFFIFNSNAPFLRTDKLDHGPSLSAFYLSLLQSAQVPTYLPETLCTSHPGDKRYSVSKR
jgi:hypothetical protein